MRTARLRRRSADRVHGRDRALAEIGVLGVMVFWAGNFIVVKGAMEILPPIGFAFLRYCIAAITLLILLRWREGAIRLPRGDIMPILLLGVIGFGSTRSCGRWRSRPSRPVTRRCSSPRPRDDRTAGDGRRARQAQRSEAHRCSSRSPAWRWSSRRAGLELGASLVGDVLTLVAAACWAVYTVFGARVLRRHSPLMTTTWAILAGTVFMAPLGIAQLATSGLLGGLPELGLPMVLALLYSGTLAAGFAEVIVFRGVELLGPIRVTALQFLVPALAVAMAAISSAKRSARSRSSAASSSSPASRSCGAARGRVGGARRGRSEAWRGDRPGRCGATHPAAAPRGAAAGHPRRYGGTVALTDVSGTVMAEHLPGVWEERSRLMARAG